MLQIIEIERKKKTIHFQGHTLHAYFQIYNCVQFVEIGMILSIILYTHNRTHTQPITLVDLYECMFSCHMDLEYLLYQFVLCGNYIYIHNIVSS